MRVDSRLRGNDGVGSGDDAWCLVLSENRLFTTTFLYDRSKTGFAFRKRYAKKRVAQHDSATETCTV